MAPNATPAGYVQQDMRAQPTTALELLALAKFAVEARRWAAGPGRAGRAVGLAVLETSRRRGALSRAPRLHSAAAPIHLRAAATGNGPALLTAMPGVREGSGRGLDQRHCP